MLYCLVSVCLNVLLFVLSAYYVAYSYLCISETFFLATTEMQFIFSPKSALTFTICLGAKVVFREDSHWLDWFEGIAKLKTSALRYFNNRNNSRGMLEQADKQEELVRSV